MSAEELLATIDAEIARLQVVRATIARLMEAHRGNAPGPEPREPTPATPEVPTAEPEPTTPHRPGHTTEVRGRISNGEPSDVVMRLVGLLSDGPRSIGQLAESVGVTGPAASFHLKGKPYFEPVDPSNRLSPYRLTDLGRQMLERSRQRQ